MKSSKISIIALILLSCAFKATYASNSAVESVATIMRGVVVSGNQKGVSIPNTYEIEGHVEAGHLVYDIGCGAGYFVEKAIEKGAEVVAVDADQKGLSVLRNKGLSISILEGEFPNQFRAEDLGNVDLIYSSYMLQVVPKDEVSVILAGMHSLLKHGAKAYIIVPDLFYRLIECQGKETILNLSGTLIRNEDFVEHLKQLTSIKEAPSEKLVVNKGANSLPLQEWRHQLLGLGVSEDTIDYSIDRSSFVPEMVNLLSPSNMTAIGSATGFSSVESRRLNDIQQSYLFIFTK